MGPAVLALTAFAPRKSRRVATVVCSRDCGHGGEDDGMCFVPLGVRLVRATALDLGGCRASVTLRVSESQLCR